MAVLFGLLASVTYGSADFIGGVVSRRNHVFTVLLWAQVVGLAAVLVGLPFLTGAGPSAGALWLGGAAGVVGMFGAGFLFRGLARGRMSVVAPVTAVLAAALPVVAGLILGERPSALSLSGVVLALASIGLVSMTPEPGRSSEDPRSGRGRVAASGFPEALGAGVCFAAFFLLLDRVEDDAGLWPILGARVAALVVIAVILAVAGLTVRPAHGTGLGVAAGGFLGNAADYLFVLSTRLGLLSIVAVLTSLYPVTTVVLARTVLGERIGGAQLVGLFLAAVGVVLITAG